MVGYFFKYNASNSKQIYKYSYKGEILAMATVIKPELSPKNKYWISKHRHYELKHFCLQYPEWKQIYKDSDGYNDVSSEEDDAYTDRTSSCGILRAKYIDRMRLIEITARNTDLYFADYILKAVTEGRSYTYLKNCLGMPCGRDMYYTMYRRFFWLLSETRDQ